MSELTPIEVLAHRRPNPRATVMRRARRDTIMWMVVVPTAIASLLLTLGAPPSHAIVIGALYALLTLLKRLDVEAEIERKARFEETIAPDVAQR